MATNDGKSRIVKYKLRQFFPFWNLSSLQVKNKNTQKILKFQGLNLPLEH